MAEKRDKLKIFVVTHGPKCEKLRNSWTPLEVGAATRDHFNYELRDDAGKDNISEKNQTYCEETGLYWIWKNDKHDYVGLYHYRRFFLLSDKKITKILSSGEADFIVSSVLMKDSLYENYRKNHIINDLVTTMDVLKEQHPEYTDAVNNYINSNKFYICNMFVTRRDLLNEYCKWLFPILEEVERRTNLAGRDDFQKRYIGFLSERLLILYIMFNNLRVYDERIYYKSVNHPVLYYFVCKFFGHKTEHQKNFENSYKLKHRLVRYITG